MQILWRIEAAAGIRLKGWHLKGELDMSGFDKEIVQPQCAHCGSQLATTASKLEIPIKRGCVKRAIQMADLVYRARQAPDGSDDDLVLVTALLMIDRLAASAECSPQALLDYMSQCFRRKHQFVRTMQCKN